MQPNPSQPVPPPHSPPPAVGGPTPKRANAAAARAAGVLALLTVAMLTWFALQDIFYLDQGMTGGLTGKVLVNVLGGATAAGVLLVAAGFTFARRIPGAWTLCGLCTGFIVANVALAPVMWGVSIGDQLAWIFGFQKSNGIAVGLATIFGALTAATAAAAALVKSHGPAVTPPGS
ncbi:hypothetical protein LX16_1659 [Stackebrandtia albiflava]|uniref:Uncharacterized protein n=1 Tax=Stackebrandtia albiflava TaxID=406432 RepID=A0A562VDH8_9ACTN|nr:hypothetical protein [Stackebrandtia albiflava]TWJ15939.1 hypothetical protein LX16_1659 [Stackebrandtia albiflava]